MSSIPTLTDRDALARNRRRAGATAADFLHRAAQDEIQERLNEVNRTFTAPAIVAGHDLWSGFLPGAARVADRDLLDLTPAAHDLVIHGLCLHWANDPVGQLIQSLRALRPDGLFIAAMFGGQTLHELRGALAEAESRLTGGLSPRVLPMAEIRDLGGLLQRAGFALPVADSVRLTVTYADLPALMRDLRVMGEQNALAARSRRPPPRELFALAGQIYQAHFGLPEGRIPATFELVFLTGWSPDPGQQQPLRPGSAITRLAAALGTAGHDPQDK